MQPGKCQKAACGQGSTAGTLPILQRAQGRELSNRSLEELPRGGREAFKAKANDSQWHSACPTGPSHVPSGVVLAGGAAPQSTLLHLPLMPGPGSPVPVFEGGGRQGASLHPFCRPAGKGNSKPARRLRGRAGRKRGPGWGAEETDLLGLPGSLAWEARTTVTVWG